MSKEWLKREEYLKIVRRKGCGLIPGSVGVMATQQDENSQYFEDVLSDCPHVKFSVSREKQREKEGFHCDDWGCLWHSPGGYLAGQAVGHPLEDWSSFTDYHPPDPEKHTDWKKAKETVRKAKKEGKAARGGVEHGFFYLKLTYLRGFPNFMMDVGEEKKELKELINMVTDHWCEVVKRWVDLGVDVVSFGDDLGHQDSLPISPSSWRELIKPSYKKIFSICRENDVEVYLHTDGYVVDIIPDLIEAGVTILNPQDLVNGLDNLEKLAKGKVCIDLDIDRQKITAFGEPEEIDRHIFKCIETLGSSEGGLMLTFGAYGTPKENIAQVIRSMEKYYDWWVKKT